jgi:hypothetical protein
MASATATPTVSRRRTLARPRPVPLELPASVTAVALAGACIAFDQPLAAAILDALAVLLLVNRYALAAPADGRTLSGTARDAVPVLAAIPLLGLVSLALPLESASGLTRLSAVAGCLALVVATTCWLLRVGAGELGLRAQGWPWQIAVALLGVPLGLLAYVAVHPGPLAHGDAASSLLIRAVAIAAVLGIAQELLFRGLLTATLPGTPGVVWGSLLFAAVQVGTGDAVLGLLLSTAGAAFGMLRHRTGSVAGVAAAHAILLVGFLVIWPQVLGRHDGRGAPPAGSYGPLVLPPTGLAQAGGAARPAQPALRHASARRHRVHRRRSAAPVRTAAGAPAARPAPARAAVPRAAPPSPSAPAPRPAPSPEPAPRAPTPAPARPAPKPAPDPAPQTFDDSG